jgi:acetylornithine deacetylase/succinyl-diaminopimelate desuccinylase-like protein
MTSAVDSLIEFLRFPSISTDPKNNSDVRACSDWLMKTLSGMGLGVERYETPGHPVVVAKNDHKKGKKNILIYGHYDVQPVDPVNLWTTPPFEPSIRNKIIYARGSADNKGQMLAHVMGVKATLEKHKELPVNLTFLFEGEEEIGSPNLRPFLEKHNAELPADLIVISDTGMVGPGIPTLTYSLRGIACLEVVIKGPQMDLHSGVFGGAVMNPLLAMARLMNSFHDQEGKVKVEGFYNNVKNVADWEKANWKNLPNSDEEIKTLTGVKKLFGEPGYNSREHTWARPTLEFNGAGGGYLGAGSKTVIPSQVILKISCRLVPEQKPAEILKAVEAHIKKHMPHEVSFEIIPGHSGSPYYVDPFSENGKAAQRALQSTFHRETAFIREGGSIPIVQDFKQVLGADTLLLGLSLPDCRAHSPDENFPIENYEQGILLNQYLLQELAK